MDLQARVAQIKRNYNESVSQLSMYIAHISEAIIKIQTDNKKVVDKLLAAKSGEVYVDDATEPKDQSHILTLKEDELDMLVELMKWSKDQTESYPYLTFRMAYVYLIALFDAFLSDMLEALVLNRPEMLKSKKQISYDKLLEFGSIESLVGYLAKRELNELSYKSIKDQTDYYRERFGLDVAESGVSVEELIELRATRNLLVHGNGVVNQIYLELVNGSRYSVGDNINVDLAYFKFAQERMNKLADFIVTTLAEKHLKSSESITAKQIG